MAKKIKISGIAINEGVSRNGVKYTAEELHKFAPTLSGKPILKDHVSDTDNAIGLVELGESVNGGREVSYKGWIKEDGSGIIEKIEDGRIKEVSIGAIAEKMVKESKDSDILTAKGLHALELSTTPTPGIVGTSLKKETTETNEELEFTENDISKMIEEYYKTHIHNANTLETNSYKEVIMENKETKGANMTTPSVSEAELREMREKLAVLEKEKADLLESQRQDAIKTYEKICEAKDLKIADSTKMTVETIKALTEMAEDVPEPEEESEEESTEDASEEECEDCEEKPEAEVKSEEVEDEASEAEEKLNGFVIESSELGGFSFYKSY